MKPTVTYEEILNATKHRNIGFVDVRSPKEYHLSTIPGAFNIPILSNEAREEVGTRYVNGQISEAKRYGVEYASHHLPEMYAHYQELLKEFDELALFCSRGGMRSNAIFSLLKALGMPVSRIKGGYKAYRHYINDHLEEQLSKVHFITLYGLSGSGKTEILKELAAKGEHIVDLEACANHRGSVLGSVGLSDPYSQKQFESLLFQASQEWQKDEIVFTEGESKRIGKVVMPPSLCTAIQEGTKVAIEAPLSYRVAQIHHDYVENNDVEVLANSLDAMNKSINEEKVSAFQQQIKNGEADLVIEQLLLSYYDPRYSHNHTKREQTFYNTDAKETAQEIIAWKQMK